MMVSSRVSWCGRPGALGAIERRQTEFSFDPLWGDAKPLKVTFGNSNFGALIKDTNGILKLLGLLNSCDTPVLALSSSKLTIQAPI
jgi:hypothetical protein